MLHLDVAADRPGCIRRRDAVGSAADGAARISYGLLNLTHRDGHEDLKPLEPGRRYKVRIHERVRRQRIGAGNRLRLAISSAYLADRLAFAGQGHPLRHDRGEHP